MVKVSVLIPCYNGDKFIERCFNSLLNQEYTDMEIIFVDDGSIDNTAKIVKLWKEIFNDCGISFKYVYQHNQGLGGAVNTGLKYVEGKYLTLLDVDDIFLPGSIHKRADFLDNNEDFSLVRTDGFIVKENNQNLVIRKFCFYDYEKNSSSLFDLLIEGKTYNWAGSYMLRTDILFQFYRDRNIYESRYGQNLQLILPVCYMRKTGFIDEPLMKYILQEQSLSQDHTDNAYKKELKNIDGYSDIRMKVIELMNCKEQYIDKIKVLNFESKLLLAINYKNKSDANKFHDILQKNYKVSLEIELIYLKFNKSLINTLRIIFLKVKIKLTNILK